MQLSLVFNLKFAFASSGNMQVLAFCKSLHSLEMSVVNKYDSYDIFVIGEIVLYSLSISITASHPLQFLFYLFKSNHETST